MLDTSEAGYRLANDDMSALELTEVSVKSDTSTAYSLSIDNFAAFYQSVTDFERVAEEMIEKFGRAPERQHVETGESIRMDQNIASKEGDLCS